MRRLLPTALLAAALAYAPGVAAEPRTKLAALAPPAEKQPEAPLAPTVPVDPTPRPAPRRAVSADPTPESDREHGSVLPWVSVGLGAVALVAGGLLYGSAWSAASEPVRQEQADAGNVRAGLGLGLLGAGAVAVAGGLFFSGDR